MNDIEIKKYIKENDIKRVLVPIKISCSLSATKIIWRNFISNFS